jgi:hypothetical protein
MPVASSGSRHRERRRSPPAVATKLYGTSWLDRAPTLLLWTGARTGLPTVVSRWDAYACWLIGTKVVAKFSAAVSIAGTGCLWRRTGGVAAGADTERREEVYTTADIGTAVRIHFAAGIDSPARGSATRAVLTDAAATLGLTRAFGICRAARTLLRASRVDDVVALTTLPACRVLLLRAAAPSRRNTGLRLELLGRGGLDDPDRGQQRCAERPADERSPREASR